MNSQRSGANGRILWLSAGLAIEGGAHGSRSENMRSNVAPRPVLRSYKETRSNCPDHPAKLSGPTATIRGWAKMPKDVLRGDLTPAAKLVFAAIAAELYDRDTVEIPIEERDDGIHPVRLPPPDMPMEDL